MRMTGKTATFANESDQVLMPATLALHAHEPMLQSSTAKIRLKLIANEPGDSPALPLPMSEERALMALNYIVEHRVLRAVTRIATRNVATGSIGTGALNTGTEYVPHCILGCAPPA